MKKESDRSYDCFSDNVIDKPLDKSEFHCIGGVIGESFDKNHTRLYLNHDLTEYCEIPKKAILHQYKLPLETNPLGESLLWVDKKAELISSESGLKAIKTDYLLNNTDNKYSIDYDPAMAEFGYPASNEAINYFLGNTENCVSLPFDVFKPQLFRKNAELAISKLEHYLADSTIRGLALTDPAILLQQAKDLMTERHGDDENTVQQKLSAILDLYIKTGIQVHSPGYMGRQFSGVVPLAGVIDFVSSIVNQPSSFYEVGQLPNVAEKIMADEFNRFIGWPPGSFDMVTTSGCSLANLTAILAARNDKLPGIWLKGRSALESSTRPAIAVSEDVHYSITRAAGILGIGEAQVVRLPVNRNKQICIEQVRPALDAAAKRGLNVFCMVGSAGSTSIGAFDPIQQLAQIAEENNIWLHIDGAHGASFLVSDKLRHKLKGLDKVDSFALDAHKMMFVPAMCTLLFYKNKEKSQGAFHQDASYVFEKEPDIYTEFDSGKKNFECTKRPLIMSLWVLWTIYGKALFAGKLDYLCRLTEQTYQILQQQPDFETLHQPEANILCFRYRPSNRQPPDLQLAIRNKIRKQGKFFISKVDIDGEPALRVVFMNHQINTDHFRMLLDEIRTVGQELLSNSN